MTRHQKADRIAVVRQLRASDDSGATLLLALIFTTVVAVVVAAVLSFVDVSMKTTTAVQAEAAGAAWADGAAQIAVNDLRDSSYTGSPTDYCFDKKSNTLSLGSAYTAPDGQTYSATVVCSTDTTNTHQSYTPAINDTNKPPASITTLGTSSSEHGLDVNTDDWWWQQTKKGMHGDVVSASSIDTDGLITDGSVTAHSCHTSSRITVGTGQTKNCSSTKAVADPGASNPAYAPPVPSGTTSQQDVPVSNCNFGGWGHGYNNTHVVTFSPGIYTDVDALNDLTTPSGFFGNSCGANILYFKPGVYYFDFDNSSGSTNGSTSSHTSDPWTIFNGEIVGGTISGPNGPTTTPPNNWNPDEPGACESPIPPAVASQAKDWSFPGADKGVEFVFAGTSRIALQNSIMDLCGSYETNKPPITIYGLSSSASGLTKDKRSGQYYLSLPLDHNKTYKLYAERGCITKPGDTSYGPFDGWWWRGNWWNTNKSSCAVISAAPEYSFNPFWWWMGDDTHTALYVEGTTYTPAAAINLQLDYTVGPVFEEGVIARSLYFDSDANNHLYNPFAMDADNVVASTAETVTMLSVYTCPGTTPCSTTGGATPALKAKIGIVDPNPGSPVAGDRQITVYDWSVQRN